MIFLNVTCKRRRQYSGFSLVEMSVTLLIVALALASIIGGAHLTEVANLNKLAGKLSFYKQATEDFREKYSAYPGDMPNADEFWSGVVAGDGNNRLDDTINPTCITECLGAWQHLGKANMVTGAYTGIISTATSSGYDIGTNVPDSGIKAAYYMLSFADMYGRKGNVIQLSGSEQSGPNEGVVTPETARNLDKKYDDANPSEGGFLAARSESESSTGGLCVTGDYSSDTSVDYDLSDATASCRIMIQINVE